MVSLLKNLDSTSKFSFFNFLSTMKKCKLESNVKKRCLHFQNNPLRCLYKPRLSSMTLPPPMWSKFYRQQDAFDFAESKQDAKVFSVELPGNVNAGSRSFVVASLEEFWSYYKQLPLSRRNFYEVIQQGTFCHLYFDLEFDQTINQSSDGENMVKLWIDLIGLYLQREFEVETSRENVIELDSTTDLKFSQHLIWHLPKAYFKDNQEVGNFVKMVCSDIRNCIQLKLDDPLLAAKHWLYKNKIVFSDLECLLINKSPEQSGLFVDEGVYTKNRNFRLFKSTKKGKNTELKFSNNCCFILKAVNLQSTCCSFHSPVLKPDESCCRDKEKLIFFASLASNVHNHEVCNVLEMPSSNDQLSPPSKKQLYSGNTKRFDVDVNDEIPSPLLKELLDFVTNYIKQYNDTATVYRITQTKNAIFFDIVGTRFCPTIGREHKSNNIFVVINLDTKFCYHRCYDHDCQVSNTKPTPFPLPSSIVNSKHFTFFAEFSNEVSDSDLVSCVESCEKETTCK